MSDRTGIDRLTNRQREIVQLRCTEDLTWDEVALRLGVRPHTIKNHMTKILRKVGRSSSSGICFDFGRLVAERER